MGMQLFSRGSNTAPPNPNPNLFHIIRSHEIRHARLTVVMVNYPGCTTYGGDKVSVYDKPLSVVTALARLDPHFTENRAENSPIARFPGDANGWQMAVLFAEALARYGK
jgi:hypothetical protein